MSLTFELVLLYYDNPKALDAWLARYTEQTDLCEMAWPDGSTPLGHLTIADTGSPNWDGLEVLRKRWGSARARYIRADTEEIRKRMPPDIHCRPTSWVMNLATDYTKADVMIYSVLGSIPPQTWFRDVLREHEANERILLQAKQHRLHSATYFKEDYNKPPKEAFARGQMSETTGMPDFSVRRKHLVEIGGWDESMVAWGMVDIDLCSRFTGKMDTGIMAHEWVKSRTNVDVPPYKNLGLELRQPGPKGMWSVVCNDYDGALPQADVRRDVAAQLTMSQWLGMWGVIGRNYGRVPCKHEVR